MSAQPLGGSAAATDLDARTAPERLDPRRTRPRTTRHAAGPVIWLGGAEGRWCARRCVGEEVIDANRRKRNPLGFEPSATATGEGRYRWAGGRHGQQQDSAQRAGVCGIVRRVGRVVAGAITTSGGRSPSVAVATACVARVSCPRSAHGVALVVFTRVVQGGHEQPQEDGCHGRRQHGQRAAQRCCARRSPHRPHLPPAAGVVGLGLVMALEGDHRWDLTPNDNVFSVSGQGDSWRTTAPQHAARPQAPCR